MTSRVLEIKASLNDAKPAVWRTFLIPGDATFAQLHTALQVLFSWEDRHLYQFTLDRWTIGVPDEDLDDTLHDSRTITLAGMPIKRGSELRYEYDFGDGWEVTLKVVEMHKPDAVSTPLACLSGKRAGPPEDCGGIPGFENLLAALKDPAHPERDELRDWVGPDYNPAKFDPNAATPRLFEALGPGSKHMPLPFDSEDDAPPPEDELGYIVRSAITVSPKEPVLKWLKKNRSLLESPQREQLPTLEDLRQYASIAFLVPPMGGDIALDNYLELNADRIFVEMLRNWIPESEYFPKRRNQAALRKWFDVELTTYVRDLVGAATPSVSPTPLRLVPNS